MTCIVTVFYILCHYGWRFFSLNNFWFQFTISWYSYHGSWFLSLCICLAYPWKSFYFQFLSSLCPCLPLSLFSTQLTSYWYSLSYVFTFLLFLLFFIFLSLLFKKVTYSNLRFLIYQETKPWLIISINSLLRKITNVRIHTSSPSQFCYDLRFLSQCIICFFNYSFFHNMDI